MKLLLDANISWRLCSFLAEIFGECRHVNEVDLPRPAKDSAIWQYAEKNEYTIVSRDSDFLHFLDANGFPPKLILVKTGNTSNKQLERIFLQAKASIVELHDKDDEGLLEIL